MGLDPLVTRVCQSHHFCFSPFSADFHSGHSHILSPQDKWKLTPSHYTPKFWNIFSSTLGSTGQDYKRLMMKWDMEEETAQSTIISHSCPSSSPFSFLFLEWMTGLPCKVIVCDRGVCVEGTEVVGLTLVILIIILTVEGVIRPNCVFLCWNCMRYSQRGTRMRKGCLYSWFLILGFNPILFVWNSTQCSLSIQVSKLKINDWKLRDPGSKAKKILLMINNYWIYLLRPKIHTELYFSYEALNNDK